MAGVIVYLITTGVLLFIEYVGWFIFTNASSTFPQQAGSSTSSILLVVAVVVALLWILQGVRAVRASFRGGPGRHSRDQRALARAWQLSPTPLGHALWLGLRLGVIALLVIIGGETLVFATHTYVGSLFIVLTVAVLAIRAELLPARRSGSLGAATLAGGIVALAIVIGFPVLPGQSQYMAVFVGFGVVALVLSIVSGLIGRRQYRTSRSVQVPQASG